MLESLLIANRGEIARRIIRTCRKLGIRAVVVHSEADARAAFVREADEAVPIGPAPARESYLSIPNLMAAACMTGVEAIHPGYGFLSENAEFAEAVLDAGLIWIGPPPAAIRAMGRKDAAKALMRSAGVPVTPGYQGDDQSDDRLAAEAARIGFPVLIKAVAGGGGKGMRRVDGKEAFLDALASCRREARSSFGDDRVLIETYVMRPRHIEVQIFADRFGETVHLYERDCSLQRRHQKVIEEAPAPGLTDAVRMAITSAAIRAAKAVGYVGAGTVEFIADASAGLDAGRIWFMEMNTRLQVEHPVTEAITGLDLVEWQIRVASGEALPMRQEAIAISGHAIEARLYAEDPSTGFLPSIGSLDRFRLPEAGIRVDSAVEEGDAVTPHYDPMIAKLIAHAPTREMACRRLAEAASAVQVWPVRTNAGFLARALAHPDFVAGAVDTGFIPDRLDSLLPPSVPSGALLKDAARHFVAGRMAGFRLNAPPQIRVALGDGEAVHQIDLEPADLAGTSFDGETLVLFEAGRGFAFTRPRAGDGRDHDGAGDGAIVSPMPGLVIAVSVAVGDQVAKGQGLVTIEAMKMETMLQAPFAGRVAELSVAPGQRVAEHVPLVRIVPLDI